MTAEPGSTPAEAPDLAEELALLAHDIRSALTDVMTGLELIDDTALPQRDRHQLDRVRASGEGLFRLLEVALSNVLGQSTADLPKAPVHLDKLLRDLMRRWAHPGRAEETEAKAILVAEPDLPEVIACNHVAVERVLANLLGNALTHSGGGRVTLHVARPTPKALCFTVQDEGPGFPAVVPMPTGSRALPAWQTGEGHGLGLSISQSLAERMGGRIILRNTKDGHGAAEFWLPLEPALPPQTPTVMADTALHGLRILLADDNPTQRLVMSQYLAQSGAEVVSLRDGASALASLRLGGFGAAVLDHDMPGHSGPDICAALRADSGPMADVPILVLTAHHGEAPRAAALAAGADAVLQKPIPSPDALIRAVSAIIHPMRAEPPSKPPDARPNTPPIDPSDFRRLLSVAGDEFAAELVQRFAADLAEVRSQLHAALPQMDLHGLRACSHVLVSLAGTAGAHLLSDAARRFNLAAQALDTDSIQNAAPDLLDGLEMLIAFIDKIAAERQAGP
ncbi:response regulator [Pseudorhodobacter sp. E13]|uniref:hybrid sensor histidine kinase/response regulator n=1 Tax=Pseudorhodobacter sp. E13 TaxID=2487931 RepID=UPI000F8E8329|nr:response regulator [Pseudorhodobacter sp. E13]